MSKRANEEADPANCETNYPYKPFQDAMRPLTGKWKIEIMWALAQRTHRFGELRRALPGITQHMLTVQLRELESDGLVKRTVYDENPPRVEYEITEAAYGLRPVFKALIAWSQQYGPISRKLKAEKERQMAGEPLPPAP
jgi:DNA-binding HxlR family transcriptional regulator